MAIVRALDPAAVRADFPILEREINGRPLAYLDSAATSLKPRAVADAVAGYLTRYSANVHRGVYSIGEEATAAYEGARVKIGRFINAPSAREIVRPTAHQPGRHDRHDRARASLEHRPLAAADPGEGC
jgi:cysteine desulfurase / selenocysteine lyase